MYFAAKSTTGAAPLNGKYLRIAKIRVRFSWNLGLKFFKVLSISGHSNNLKLHFELNTAILFLDLVCPELQKYKNQDIRNIAGRKIIN